MSKKSLIQIRIESEEKDILEKKLKILNMSISDYTRFLYKHGEILLVPEQVQKDIRGLSININQIARRLNGGSVTQEKVILELQDLVLEYKKKYIR
ncbi:MobC family plasmid mobilization relaxosome protein [Chryseobacterium sp. LC2016-29]|uniref:plasmid mobilization protein n=1 Tax=Chryseobacterium sp. LC2016-29 TaxID=2897331 RepID=UPI001E467E73|nr:plasmid mobilization relaxosome protein MobC [Chryseobacterium sp. LC2016-29]MCD0480354.1 MobC family plasmid mobilization relaxosome protein [Chryseobacterium sp. LC2016-29]